VRLAAAAAWPYRRQNRGQRSRTLPNALRACVSRVLRCADTGNRTPPPTEALCRAYTTFKYVRRIRRAWPGRAHSRAAAAAPPEAPLLERLARSGASHAGRAKRSASPCYAPGPSVADLHRGGRRGVLRRLVGGGGQAGSAPRALLRRLVFAREGEQFLLLVGYFQTRFSVEVCFCG
jgi:hypothetical protein